MDGNEVQNTLFGFGPGPSTLTLANGEQGISGEMFVSGRSPHGHRVLSLTLEGQLIEVKEIG